MKYFIVTNKGDIVLVKPSTVFKMYGFTFFTHWQEFFGWKLTNQETGHLAYGEGYYYGKEEKEFIKEAKQFLLKKGEKEVKRIINKLLKVNLSK